MDPVCVEDGDSWEGMGSLTPQVKCLGKCFADSSLGLRLDHLQFELHYTRLRYVTLHSSRDS